MSRRFLRPALPVILIGFLLLVAGCKSSSHSSGGNNSKPAAALCCASGVDLSLTRAAMLELINRAVERPTSATLLPAAWQGLLGEARAEGVRDANAETPPLHGDSKMDFTAFNDAFNKVVANHRQAVDVQKLNYAAIDRMAQSLDDTHTTFLPPEIAGLEERREAGNLGTSTGMRLERVTERPPIVLEVTPGSAAADAGVLPGDSVLALNGQKIESISPRQASRALEGPDGSRLTLDLRHAGSARVQRVTLTRRTISLDLVHTATLPGNVGYIRLREFPVQVPIQLQARQALSDFDAAHTSGVIVDLRGNPGGALGMLQAVLSEFVSQSPLAYVGGSSSRPQPVPRVGAFDLHQKLIVLTDDGSASSAEMFAAAVQEYGDGLIVGQHTCGCLVAAEFFPVDGDKSRLEIGEAQVLTPTQREVEKHPIQPNVPVAADPRLLGQGRDPQLEAGLISLGVDERTARTATIAVEEANP